MNNISNKLNELQKKKKSLEEEKRVLKSLYQYKLEQISEIDHQIDDLNKTANKYKQNYKKYKKRTIKKYIIICLQIIGVFSLFTIGPLLIKNTNIINISLNTIKIICGIASATTLLGVGTLNDDIKGLKEAFINLDVQDINDKKNELMKIKSQKTNELKILNTNLKENNERMRNCFNQSLELQQLFEPKTEVINLDKNKIFIKKK